MKSFTTIAALAMVLLVSPEAGAQEAPPLWKVMDNALADAAYDPMNTELRARSMLARKTVLEDCDSLLLVEHLLRFSSTVLSTPWPPDGFVPTDGCEHVPSPLLYFRGAHAFYKKRYAEAEPLFRSAAETAHQEGSVDFQYRAHQALGATLTYLHRFKEAVDEFNLAYDLAPQAINPVELNNLAYAHILAGQCRSAISWANIALDRLAASIEEEEQIEEFNTLHRNVILVTRLIAEQTLGDDDAALETLQEIDLNGGWNGRELAAIATLTEYLQWRNDVERFAVIRPFLNRLVEASDPTELIESVGANYRLFPPWSSDDTWRQTWEELKSVPVVFRGGLGVTCQEEAQQSIAAGSSVVAAWRRNWLVLALGLCTVCAGGYLLVLLSRWREWLRWKALPTDALWQRVDALLKQEGPLREMERMLVVRAVQVLAQTEWKAQQQQLIDMRNWPTIEQDVARALAQGEHTKDIAQRLNLSVSTVYKARQDLRVRLNLQPSDSLRRRLMDFFPIALVAICCSASAQADVPVPSVEALSREVIESIQADDSARWMAAMSELRIRGPHGLPEPFDVALLPQEERPEWAQVDDTLMWRWFKSGSVALDIGGQADENAVPLSASPKPALKRLSGYLSPGIVRQWPAWAGLLFCLVVAIFAMEWRGRRVVIRKEQAEWEALLRSLAQNRDLAPAQEHWKTIRVRQPQGLLYDGYWNLLNRPEQEVAQLTAQRWSVQQIADHMSCSTGNVYNLRSSIRQKWSLDAADDLVRFIQALQADNE